MFSGETSPRKRKHSEFHDPDYPKDESSCDNGYLSSSKTSIAKRQKVQESLGGQQSEYLRKIQEVIEREFNNELVFKQDQLVEIDERLLKARELLDKLRCTLVLSYYKRQDLPPAVRWTQPLFTREDKGPQLQIHPSLKKLIGKKPKDLSDVIRSCPKRTAAQNAVQTIRAKSEVQKREERKLKQIIRGQGIVIDHSVNEGSRTDIAALLAQIKKTPRNISQSNPSIDKEHVSQSRGKALNSARLNNKVKHLFVVGNTSKYIGSEQERDSRNKSQVLTHKWLVYVQTKDPTVPIEKYIRKVRFQLHHSYRPNDVVDVQAPPFHVARRGWGEFPIRVQLYFHPEYNQKPVQLLHTVILDKTLSGIQSLGAETLLEVWLRDVSCDNDGHKSEMVVPDVKIESDANKDPHISPSEHLVDDNLLDFLNKIESSQTSISADIEKIHPTFVISETMADKNSNKFEIPSKSVLKSPKQQRNSSDNINNIPQNTYSSTDIDIATRKVNNGETILRNHTSAVKSVTQTLENKLDNSFNDLPEGSKILPVNSIITSVVPTNTTTLNKTSIIFNTDGKNITPLTSTASSVRRTILPLKNVNTHSTQDSSYGSINSVKTSSANSNAPKQILQKKLVQLVDSTGKVKYMQMLVAATSTAPSTKIRESASMAPKLVAVCANNTRTTSGELNVNFIINFFL